MEERDSLAESDANAALAELDRGMQSANVADQSAAIVRIPVLFCRFPFPIFINASVLKLAEVFRSGTNFSRQLIVKVAEKTELHMVKLISLDTIAKRILTVSHSNDPIARALTLRMLGTLASVMKDEKNIHHLVISSLDSHDLEELSGAISAVSKFARHSMEFSRGVFDKIAQMLTDITIPLDTKLSLIPIFKQMRADGETTDRIFQFCSNVLLANSVDNFQIITVLDTLTSLTLLSLFHVGEQLHLLVKTFRSGSSKRVKVFTLKCLLKIAKTSPHAYHLSHIEAILDICRISVDPKLTCSALEVLCGLCKSPCISMFLQSDDNKIVPVCKTLMSRDSEKILIKSLLTFTHLSINAAINVEQKNKLVADCFASLMFFIPTLNWHDSSQLPLLKELLDSTVLFAVEFPQYSAPIAEPLVFCITQTHNEEILKLGLQYVGLLVEKSPSSSSHVAEVFEKSPAMNRNCDFIIDNIDIVSSIFLLPFDPQSTTDKSTAVLTAVIGQSAEKSSPINCWKLFKVARRAMRMGHSAIAKDIWQQLEYKISSQYCRHWVKGVTAACEADVALMDTNSSFLISLQNSISHLHRSLLNLKMSQIEKADVPFDIDLLTVRKNFGSALVQLLTSWNVAKLIPPPTQGNERPEQRFVDMMQQSARDFKEIKQQLDALKRRCFDSDPETLSFLNLLLLQSQWLAHEISNFLCNSFQEGPFVAAAVVKMPSSCLSAMSSRFNWCVEQLEANRDKFQPFSPESLNLFGHLVEILTRVPLYFPRFFFQNLQKTSLKMEISPRPSGFDTGLTVPAGQQLSLKVEGIISYGGPKPKCFRSVTGVTLKIRLERLESHNSAVKSGETLRKEAEMNGDYFTVEFLLSVTHTCHVEIEADLVDSKDGEIWQSGVKERLKVSVLGSGLKRHPPVVGLSQITTTKVESR